MRGCDTPRLVAGLLSWAAVLLLLLLSHSEGAAATVGATYTAVGSGLWSPEVTTAVFVPSTPSATACADCTIAVAAGVTLTVDRVTASAFDLLGPSSATAPTANGITTLLVSATPWSSSGTVTPLVVTTGTNGSCAIASPWPLLPSATDVAVLVNARGATVTVNLTAPLGHDVSLSATVHSPSNVDPATGVPAPTLLQCDGVYTRNLHLFVAGVFTLVTPLQLALAPGATACSLGNTQFVGAPPSPDVPFVAVTFPQAVPPSFVGAVSVASATFRGPVAINGSVVSDTNVDVTLRDGAVLWGGGPTNVYAITSLASAPGAVVMGQGGGAPGSDSSGVVTFWNAVGFATGALLSVVQGGVADFRGAVTAAGDMAVSLTAGDLQFTGPDAVWRGVGVLTLLFATTNNTVRYVDTVNGSPWFPSVAVAALPAALTASSLVFDFTRATAANATTWPVAPNAAVTFSGGDVTFAPYVTFATTLGSVVTFGADAYFDQHVFVTGVGTLAFGAGAQLLAPVTPSQFVAPNGAPVTVLGPTTGQLNVLTESDSTPPRPAARRAAALRQLWRERQHTSTSSSAVVQATSASSERVAGGHAPVASGGVWLPSLQYSGPVYVDASTPFTVRSAVASSVEARLITDGGTITVQAGVLRGAVVCTSDAVVVLGTTSDTEESLLMAGRVTVGGQAEFDGATPPTLTLSGTMRLRSSADTLSLIPGVSVVAPTRVERNGNANAGPGTVRLMGTVACSGVTFADVVVLGPPLGATLLFVNGVLSLDSLQQVAGTVIVDPTANVTIGLLNSVAAQPAASTTPYTLLMYGVLAVTGGATDTTRYASSLAGTLDLFNNANAGALLLRGTVPAGRAFVLASQTGSLVPYVATDVVVGPGASLSVLGVTVVGTNPDPLATDVALRLQDASSRVTVDNGGTWVVNVDGRTRYPHNRLSVPGTVVVGSGALSFASTVAWARMPQSFVVALGQLQMSTALTPYGAGGASVLTVDPGVSLQVLGTAGLSSALLQGTITAGPDRTDWNATWDWSQPPPFSATMGFVPSLIFLAGARVPEPPAPPLTSPVDPNLPLGGVQALTVAVGDGGNPAESFVTVVAYPQPQALLGAGWQLAGCTQFGQGVVLPPGSGFAAAGFVTWPYAALYLNGAVLRANASLDTMADPNTRLPYLQVFGPGTIPFQDALATTYIEAPNAIPSGIQQWSGTVQLFGNGLVQLAGCQTIDTGQPAMPGSTVPGAPTLVGAPGVRVGTWYGQPDTPGGNTNVPSAATAFSVAGPSLVLSGVTFVGGAIPADASAGTPANSGAVVISQAPGTAWSFDQQVAVAPVPQFALTLNGTVVDVNATLVVGAGANLTQPTVSGPGTLQLTGALQAPVPRGAVSVATVQLGAGAGSSLTLWSADATGGSSNPSQRVAFEYVQVMGGTITVLPGTLLDAAQWIEVGDVTQPATSTARYSTVVLAGGSVAIGVPTDRDAPLPGPSRISGTFSVTAFVPGRVPGGVVASLRLGSLNASHPAVLIYDWLVVSGPPTSSVPLVSDAPNTRASLLTTCVVADASYAAANGSTVTVTLTGLLELLHGSTLYDTSARRGGVLRLGDGFALTGRNDAPAVAFADIRVVSGTVWFTPWSSTDHPTLQSRALLLPTLALWDADAAVTPSGTVTVRVSASPPSSSIAPAPSLWVANATVESHGVLRTGGTRVVLGVPLPPSPIAAAFAQSLTTGALIGGTVSVVADVPDTTVVLSNTLVRAPTAVLSAVYGGAALHVGNNSVLQDGITVTATLSAVVTAGSRVVLPTAPVMGVLNYDVFAVEAGAVVTFTSPGMFSCNSFSVSRGVVLAWPDATQPVQIDVADTTLPFDFSSPLNDAAASPTAATIALDGIALNAPNAQLAWTADAGVTSTLVLSHGASVTVSTVALLPPPSPSPSPSSATTAITTLAGGTQSLVPAVTSNSSIAAVVQNGDDPTDGSAPQRLTLLGSTGFLYDPSDQLTVAVCLAGPTVAPLDPHHVTVNVSHDCLPTDLFTVCLFQPDVCGANSLQPCVAGQNGPNCPCKAGWGGDTCTVPVHACASNPCAPGIACSEQQGGGYTCACGPGDVAVNSAQLCVPCPAGTASAVFGATCASCPPGTASRPGSAVCTPCAAGYYSNTSTTAACSACRADTYVPGTGATACAACPAVDDWAAGGVCPTGSSTPAMTAQLLQPTTTYTDPMSASLSRQQHKVADFHLALAIGGVCSIVALGLVLGCLSRITTGGGPRDKEPPRPWLRLASVDALHAVQGQPRNGTGGVATLCAMAAGVILVVYAVYDYVEVYTSSMRFSPELTQGVLLSAVPLSVQLQLLGAVNTSCANTAVVVTGTGCANTTQPPVVRVLPGNIGCSVAWSCDRPALDNNGLELAVNVSDANAWARALQLTVSAPHFDVEGVNELATLLTPLSGRSVDASDSGGNSDGGSDGAARDVDWLFQGPDAAVVTVAVTRTMYALDADPVATDNPYGYTVQLSHTAFGDPMPIRAPQLGVPLGIRVQLTQVIGANVVTETPLLSPVGLLAQLLALLSGAVTAFAALLRVWDFITAGRCKACSRRCCMALVPACCYGCLCGGLVTSNNHRAPASDDADAYASLNSSSSGGGSGHAVLQIDSDRAAASARAPLLASSDRFATDPTPTDPSAAAHTPPLAP